MHRKLSGDKLKWWKVMSRALFVKTLLKNYHFTDGSR